jgi:hypothetical protein
MVYTGIGDCRAVQPGYEIPYSQYSASMKGLPGMSGGKRTRKMKQRGGRYGFFPEGDVNPHGQAWWAGSYAPVQRIGCEGGSFNPLNPTHTGSSAPPGAANPNYYLKGGAQLAPATYGVGDVDSMYYYAPTAGYANTASTWKDSVGAPVQIQVPYAAREMNQACLSTGGHPPLTGALQKGGKKSRKQKRKQRGGNPLNNLRSTIRSRAAGLPSFSNIRGWLGLGQPVQPEQNVEMNVGEVAVANAPGPVVNEPMNAQGPVVNQPMNAVVPPLNNSNVNMNTGSNSMNVNTEAPVVVGGRKRRHRKHKKGTKKQTHKRKH